ncbi:hypothetical protein Tco_0971754 [Tanacetum coccineum]
MSTIALIPKIDYNQQIRMLYADALIVTELLCLVEYGTVEYGVSTSIGYDISSSLSNTAYSCQLINMAYPLPLDTGYRSSGTEAEIFDFRAKFFYLSPGQILLIVYPLFQELRENTFSDSDNEDTNEHIEKVLEKVDLFHVPNITVDQLMLRVFLISLTGAASRWLRNKPTGSIKTWEDLKTKFWNKYCPPGRTAKKMEEINNFQQESDETLFQAWERFKELLMKCPQHYLTEMQEIKKVNEKVYAAQVGCEQCKGPHYTKYFPQKEEGKTLEEAYYTQFGGPFQGGGYRATTLGYYQRNNINPSYQERRQSMEDTLSKFMSESAKRHEENSNLIKEIQATTDASIRNQGALIKSLEIQIGQISKNSTLLYKSRQMTVPFPSHLDNHYCKEEEGNHGPKFTEDYGAPHINNTIPRKEKDPGSFTLPCFINDVCFDNALVDLGASVSVMPLSTYLNLGLCKLAHTRLTVELADRTVKYPKGIAKNVLVGIGKFTFPVDFIILDMPEDIKVPLILGRPFLSTARAKIDVYKRKITLRVGEEKIIFKSVKPASSIIKRVYMLSSRERMELDLEARIMEETLVLNRSLDPFLEDYIKLNYLNEPFELRRNQGDDLIPTIKEGEVIKEFRTRDEDLDIEIDDYPILEDMDAYRDEGMGDIIVGEPFLRKVLYKVEDIATCLVEYVKFWEDWEVDRYGNANLGRYNVSVPALTKDHKGIKINMPYPERINTPYSRYGINIIYWEDTSVVPTLRDPKKDARVPRNESNSRKANVQCYYCNEKGHYASDCPKLRVHDAKYFREQMFLDQKDKLEATSNEDRESDENGVQKLNNDAKAISENLLFSTSNICSESNEVKTDSQIPKMPKERKLLKMFEKMALAINALRDRIDVTLLEDRKRRWMSDSQNSLREFYKTDVLPMSVFLSKTLKELKQELMEEKNELLENEIEKISSDSKDIQANLLKRIKILENDFKQSQAQSIDFELKLQHPKEKMACDVSWKSRLSTLNDENVLLKNQADSVVKERENSKLEYQKLFNSIKATRTQHQKELDDLIEHVNLKTYAYADVRSQNQDLLMTISELKNKIKTIEKGKNVNTKSDKSKTSGTLLYVTLLPKNIAVKAKKVSKTKVNADRTKLVTSHSIPKNKQSQKQKLENSNSVRRPQSKDTKLKNRVLKNTNDKSSSAYVRKVSNSRVKIALFTSPVPAKSRNLGATSVIAKSRFSIAKTLTVTNKVIQLVYWIVDSGCLKHMSGNLQLLRNFIEKFIGTVRFGNDHFATIIGYGDYNLEGVDLLTSSHESNLYTISISELAASSPVCLMSKSTSTKSWLWHRRLSHLNFGTVNQLTSKDLVDGLLKFKYDKYHLCSACEQGKSKKASFPSKLVPST